MTSASGSKSTASFFPSASIYDDAVRKGRNLSGVFTPAATELIPEALLRDAPSPVLVATWVETIDDQRELEPRDVAKIFSHEISPRPP